MVMSPRELEISVDEKERNGSIVDRNPITSADEHDVELNDIPLPEDTDTPPHDDDPIETNKEPKKDENDPLGMEPLHGIDDQEGSEPTEDDQNDSESSIDPEHQSSKVDEELSTQNGADEENDIPAHSEDSTLSLKSESRKWNPLIIIVALLLLIGVVVGIVVISQTRRKTSPVPTDDISQSPTMQPSMSTSRAPNYSASPTAPGIPDNDVCAGALGPLVPNFSSNYGTIVNAGVDTVDRCGDVKDSGPGVWYYTFGTGGEMMAHTCLGTNFNSQVTIFSGSCEKPVCIEANDDFCGSGKSQSAVSWESSYGEMYYILVTGNSDFEDGSFNLMVGARSNDECSTAIGPLTVEENSSVSGSTIGATPNDISCNGVENESNSVWYQVRGTGGDMTVDWCEEIDFAAKITILTGSCDDLECTTVLSEESCRVTWKSILSRNYYVLVAGQTEEDTGDFTLHLSSTDFTNNDKCQDAIGPLALDGIPIEGTTAMALEDTDAPFCFTAITAKGLWYFVEGTVPLFRHRCATLHRTIHDYPFIVEAAPMMMIYLTWFVSMGTMISVGSRV